jgi:hypothetical protein
MFASFFGKIALGLLWSKAKAVSGWQALSPHAKKIVLGIVAAVVLFFVHQHFAHRALKNAATVAVAAEDARISKQALALKAKIDALTLQIATTERNRLNEENARIDRSADALLVHGPGKAACTLRSEPSAATGGPAPLGSEVGARLASVPNAGGASLIALPFNDAVTAFDHKDKDSAEVDSWHRWYNELLKAWPSLVTAASGSSYTGQGQGGKIAN